MLSKQEIEQTKIIALNSITRLLVNANNSEELTEIKTEISEHIKQTIGKILINKSVYF